LAQSETLINKTWDVTFGAPNDFEWVASVIDNGGNLITTGHLTINGTNTELLLTKHAPDGSLLWQKEFQPSSNTKNSGVVLDVDANDNIYVGGVTSASTNIDDFDFLILKFNSSGTEIWNKTFDGSGNGIDIPTAIIADQTKVYVSGPSKGSGTGIDYWVLKLSTFNGNISWEKRYDFAGLDDFPVSMEVDSSGNVVLIGSSAKNSLTWEMALVKYGESSGTVISEQRIVNDSLGFSMPSAMTKDPAGNFVIAGITTSNGTNFDILTVKVNNDFDVLWK